jgi:hypothetical protein
MYRLLHLADALTRGEYRCLPDGRYRACCLDCGALVDTWTLFPVAPHGCHPTPDPEAGA